MYQFENGQRVRVIDTTTGLAGLIGTVTRLRYADYGAWVEMSDPIPAAMACFPDDDDPRRNHVLLYPEQCEES